MYFRYRAVGWIGLIAGLIGSAGCRTGNNYLDAGGPRYAGGSSERPAAAAGVRPFRVVSFNVEFAVRVDSAIALLETDPALRDADVVLLQEMDASGTRRIAEALGFTYVYYPAVMHRLSDRVFGKAVLARGPSLEDSKLILPHPSLFARSQRTATATTICAAGSPLRVYSLHLGTIADISPDERKRQLRAVLTDAATWDQVVVGGDMNDGEVGGLAVTAGYDWPTRNGPRTTILGRLDHIFTRGLEPAPAAASGTVVDNRGASDHLPVWTVLLLPATPALEDGESNSCE
jgi:endonuclease/exonuclease/phosphatase family metal-dependent hydrolase